ncbi:MAG: hypothetical protein PHQ35_03045 [Phycisphaerae bacterium]|nr:hypothetical protein [Phycisphaerae bacterium]MDD5380730.1 hypothetical protein [Phycisphaerae bacterium]
MSYSYKNIFTEIISIIIGSVLCICIFIPLFLTLSSRVQLLISTEWLPYPYLCISISCLLDVLGFGISGFLTAIVISLISRSNRIITIIIVNLLVTIATIILLSKAILVGIPWSIKNHFQVILGFSWILQMALLWVCAFLGAWLIAHRRRKKILPTPAAN